MTRRRKPADPGHQTRQRGMERGGAEPRGNRPAGRQFTAAGWPGGSSTLATGAATCSGGLVRPSMKSALHPRGRGGDRARRRDRAARRHRRYPRHPQGQQRFLAQPRARAQALGYLERTTGDPAVAASPTEPPFAGRVYQVVDGDALFVRHGSCRNRAARRRTWACRAPNVAASCGRSPSADMTSRGPRRATTSRRPAANRPGYSAGTTPSAPAPLERVLAQPGVGRRGLLHPRDDLVLDGPARALLVDMVRQVLTSIVSCTMRGRSRATCRRR